MPLEDEIKDMVIFPPCDNANVEVDSSKGGNQKIPMMGTPSKGHPFKTPQKLFVKNKRQRIE